MTILKKFLDEFKDYCQIKNIPKNIVVLLLGTALRDRAKIWFDANKEYVKTIEEFENEFKAEFFSIEQQVELRNKWNNRKYKYADGSLKSYFLKAKTEATYIMKGTGEYEINYIIVNQLPLNVRKMLATINYNESKAILQALSNLDQIEEQVKITNNAQKNQNQSIRHFQMNTTKRNKKIGMNIDQMNPWYKSYCVNNNSSRQSDPKAYNNHSPNFGQSDSSCCIGTSQKFEMPNVAFPPPSYITNNRPNKACEGFCESRMRESSLNE